MKKVKVVIFDLGGVCLSDYWAKNQRRKFAEKFNFDFSKLEEYHRRYIKKLVLGQISEMDYFQDFLNEHPSFFVSIEEAISFIRENNFAFQNVLELVNNLKKNYKIFAFTNEIKEAAEFRIEKFNLRYYFEEIFVSSVIGYDKFDKEAFEYVARKLDLPVSEILFIDNKLEYVERAKESGMNAILFENFEKLKEELRGRGVF